jgi:hypothetical protein
MSSSTQIIGTEVPARAPRRALMAGGGLLVLGLAMVGVGSAEEGSAVALGGLLLTIYGIHSFGRLGPDEDAPAVDPRDPPAEIRRAEAHAAMWSGALVAVAGLAVRLGTPPSEGVILAAWAAMIVGAVRFLGGFTALRKAAEPPKPRAKRAVSKGPQAAPSPAEPPEGRPRKKKRPKSE